MSGGDGSSSEKASCSIPRGSFLLWFPASFLSRGESYGVHLITICKGIDGDLWEEPLMGSYGVHVDP